MRHIEIITEQYLPEVKLARVWQHVNGPAPIGIISAYKNPDLTPLNVNVSRARNLAADVRAAGYGYFWVEGHWISDDTGIEYEEVPVFIVGKKGEDEKLKDLLIRLMKKYEQEAVLFSPGGQAKGFLIFPAGNMTPIGSLSIDGVARNWSELRSGGHKGRRFHFEGRSYWWKHYDENATRSWGGAMAAEAKKRSGGLGE
jgi:hypothetical protein